MIRYLELQEVLEIHARVVQDSGGDSSLLGLGGLESALAQPRMTFGGRDLYPTLGDKAASLAFSVIQNHPFADGNKRAGHAAMETFLVLNGYEIDATLEDQETVILNVAAGNLSREIFTTWVQSHLIPVA